MVYSVKTNIVPLVEGLVNAIQPFAEGNFVRLYFESSEPGIEVIYHPESIITDLTRLLCHIITLTPQEYEVKLNIYPFDPVEDQQVRICILNSGVNLTGVQKNILEGVGRPVSVTSAEGGGTRFELAIPVAGQQATMKQEAQIDIADEGYSISPFYKKLKQYLTSHFTNMATLERVAGAQTERESVFLKKVNAVILARLDQEGFDMVMLARALALSRTQLHRRLKALIGFAPARYIRYVRLQKAKEWLEKEDLTVGEVAFRTGFANLSHFTRAFREQFGFNPSELRYKWKSKEE